MQVWRTAFISLVPVAIVCSGAWVGETGGPPTTDLRSHPPAELQCLDAADSAAGEGAELQRPPAVMKLRDPMRRCLAYYFFRPETNTERGPWGVMHAIVGFGVDTQLQVGSREANAIGWLCWNRPCYDRQLLYTDGRQVIARMGPGYQGHDGQFLQVLGLAYVPEDYALQVEGRRFTVTDLIRREQLTCQSGNELTFTLIGLVHYLGTDATWRNGQGERWSIERIIQEELAQPVIGAACGGTHRIMALGYSVRKRQREGQPLEGVWQQAEEHVESYLARAYRLQNADGSFSTHWFKGAGAAEGADRALETTGHTLETLLLYVPDDELDDPRLLAAAQFLTQLMWEQRTHDWEIGPKGHALHALALYDQRVFGGQPGQRRAELARALDQRRRY